MKRESRPAKSRTGKIRAWAAEVSLLAACAILYLAYFQCNWSSLRESCRNLLAAFW